MTVVVFAHGVATRDTTDEQTMVERRDRRFRDLVFGPDATILNPYWGSFGANPAWNLDCIPKMDERYQSLGLGDELVEEGSGDELLTAARVNFPAVVAALSVADLEEQEQAGDGNDVAEAEAFWKRAADHAIDNPDPSWLQAVADDDEFLAELRKQASPGGEEALGLFDDLQTVGRRVASVLSNAANKPFARIVRERFSPQAAIFIGDVFAYLKEREPREGIRNTVLRSLREAAREANDTGRKLVLIGHSLGGVILYDLLTDPEATLWLRTELGFEFRADLLLTIGSQVAFFEELKLYTRSDPATGGSKAAPGNRVPRPECVDRWWNAFDRMDVLCFLAEPVFNECEDFEVDTLPSVLSAHSGYFYNILFYERLRTRLVEVGLL